MIYISTGRMVLTIRPFLVCFAGTFQHFGFWNSLKPSRDFYERNSIDKEMKNWKFEEFKLPKGRLKKETGRRSRGLGKKEIIKEPV